MVRAIIVADKENLFYGTRMALYGLKLVSTQKLDAFANDLEKTIININNQENSISKDGLIFKDERSREYIKIGKEEFRLKDELREALDKPNNITLNFNDWSKSIAMLGARFTENSPWKNRFLEIFSIGIPNKFFWFNPEPLYELGRKYGVLEIGEDFDISIENYVKMQK